MPSHHVHTEDPPVQSARPHGLARGLVWLGALSWAALVALVTLTPGAPEAVVTREWSLCLICGDRGTGDAILNIVMFVPFGVLLGRRRTALKVLLLGLALSMGIEVVQLGIPGRFSGLADLLWNSVGALVGAVLVGWVMQALREPWPLRAGLHWAAALPAIYLLTLGGLFHPKATGEPYVGMITPELGSFATYGGVVRGAAVNGLEVTHGPLGDASPLPRALEGDWTVRIGGEAGPPPRGIAPLVAVYDTAQTEVLMVGVFGSDLVWRERTWASALGFDRPLFRWRDAFEEIPSGQRIEVAVQRDGDERCAAVQGTRRCGFGLTPGQTWSFLLSLDGLSETGHTVLALGWMATLSLLVGLIGGPRPPTAWAAGAWLVIVGLAAVLTPLRPPTPVELSGVLLGLGAGLVLRRPARWFLFGAAPSTGGGPPLAGR